MLPTAKGDCLYAMQHMMERLSSENEALRTRLDSQSQHLDSYSSSIDQVRQLKIALTAEQRAHREAEQELRAQRETPTVSYREAPTVSYRSPYRSPHRSPPRSPPRSASPRQRSISPTSIRAIRVESATALSNIRNIKQTLSAERVALSRSSSPTQSTAVLISGGSSLAVHVPHALEEVRHLKQLLLNRESTDSAATTELGALRVMLRAEQQAHDATRAAARWSTRPYGLALMSRIAARRRGQALQRLVTGMRCRWLSSRKSGARALQLMRRAASWSASASVSRAVSSWRRAATSKPSAGD